MTRAALLADSAVVLVALLVLCCAMPAQAGCEAPKPKPVTVYKPKPQQVCTCSPMQQARKVVKRTAVVKRHLTPPPAQPVCPEPAPVREAPSAPGAGGGNGLRVVPWTLPAPVVLTDGPQVAPMVAQATQVADEPQTWRSGPIWPVAGPMVLPSVAPLAVTVPAVPEPGAWALLAVGLAFVLRVKR